MVERVGRGERSLRRRALLISWGVPPDTAGSAAIVGHLAAQFSADELVVAGEKPARGRAPSRVSQGARLHYIRFVTPFAARGTRWWRLAQAPSTIGLATTLAFWYRVDAVIAVFPDVWTLVAGYVASAVTGARLFPYLHNTYVENVPARWRPLARWIQRRVFARAECVLLMSDGMRELFVERYPDLPVAVLRHSYPFGAVGKNRCQDHPTSDGSAVFAFCGNVNASCEDAMRRLADAVRAVGGRLLLLTGTPRWALERAGITGEHVEIETVYGDRPIQERLRAADVLLLPHGFRGALSDEEYRTIFPTKTADYLATGVPILAHCPAESFLARFLREHGCAYVVDEADVPSLIAAIQQILEDRPLREQLVCNARGAQQLFDAPVVAAELRKILWGVV